MARSRFPETIALVVAERTPETFWRALRRAERSARVAELRLDYLPGVAAIVTVLEKLARRPSPLTLIATCRRRADGGEFAGSPSAQLAVLELAVRAGCRWVDVDAASLESFPPRLRKVFLRRARRIVSFHDFKRTPKRLDALYGRLKSLDADLIKLATTACNHGDAVRLLKLARKHRGCLIAVPMGAAGVPGRVLSLRAGSPLAFAALDASAAVAPGQLTLKQLREQFRVHNLGRRTRVYGVLGHPALHSLSPAMHNAAFRQEGVNAVYLPFEAASLRDFMSCLCDYHIAGLSVTAPHKEKILGYLDEVDPIAEMIGAVNTVVVRGGGKLFGCNTDYVGVLRALERYMALECSQILILGAGGSARACAFALATAGAFVSITARRMARARALAKAVGGEAVEHRTLARRSFDAIINCTPVGQQPASNQSPLLLKEINARVVFDLVYRPPLTKLLRLARRKRARTVTGLHMLVEQGAAQFSIWTGLRAPVKVMQRAAARGIR